MSVPAGLHSSPQFPREKCRFLRADVRFGYDIVDGNVFTYGARNGEKLRKIVDVFTVRAVEGRWSDAAGWCNMNAI
jgi:hypothetical protein